LDAITGDSHLRTAEDLRQAWQHRPIPKQYGLLPDPNAEREDISNLRNALDEATLPAVCPRCQKLRGGLLSDQSFAGRGRIQAQGFEVARNLTFPGPGQAFRLRTQKYDVYR